MGRHASNAPPEACSASLCGAPSLRSMLRRAERTAAPRERGSLRFACFTLSMLVKVLDDRSPLSDTCDRHRRRRHVALCAVYCLSRGVPGWQISKQRFIFTCGWEGGQGRAVLPPLLPPARPLPAFEAGSPFWAGVSWEHMHRCSPSLRMLQAILSRGAGLVAGAEVRPGQIARAGQQACTTYKCCG